MIITSYLFPDSTFSQPRLESILSALGNDKNKLVIDLSCRRKDGSWFVATNKWQTITDFELNRSKKTFPVSLLRGLPTPVLLASFRIMLIKLTTESISILEPYCSEFLIHAADVEGLQRGIDHELVTKLTEWCNIPVTYAGGGRSIEDLELVKKLSNGKVDLTIGSALDIFGGNAVKFEDCVRWNQDQK